MAKSDVFKSEYSQQYVNGRVGAMLAQKIGGENVLNVNDKFEGCSCHFMHALLEQDLLSLLRTILNYVINCNATVRHRRPAVEPKSKGSRNLEQQEHD